MSVTAKFPRGVDKQGAEQPKAEWVPSGTLASVPDWHYQAGRFFLGIDEGQYIGLDDDRHITLVAGNRGGKGVSVILPNLMLWRGSTMVIDTKGENADESAERRAEELGQRVVVLDPFETTKTPDKTGKAYRYISSFNPLAMLRDDRAHAVENAALIADALVIPSGGENSHWDESAQAYIKALCLYVAFDPKWDENRDLVQVRNLIMLSDTKPDKKTDDEEEPKSPLQKLEAWLMSAPKRMPDDIGALIAHGATDFFGRAEKERLSVLSSVRRHTQWLEYPAMRECLTDSDWKLADLKTNPQGLSIYLCLPAGRLGTHGRWLRLFVNLALEAIERTGRGKGKTGHGVLLALDEFAALGYLKQVEAAAGQLAGFGAKMLTVVQDFSQLKALYKDRWQSFLANSGATLAFANTDSFTLDELSKRLGRTTVMVDRAQPLTTRAKLEGQSTENWQPEVHPLMAGDEIARHFSRKNGNVLVIYADSAPIALKRAFSYDEAFRSFVNDENHKESMRGAA